MAFNILTVGDVHGTTRWKSINPENHDLIIFLGDYTDSYNGTEQDTYDNFKNILEFAKVNANKVKLLVGNHDVHYILLNTRLGESIMASRFSYKYADRLHELYMEHIDMFSVAYQYTGNKFTNYLWTHAGISDMYYKHKCSNHMDKQSLADHLNISWKNLDTYLFDIGYIRGGDKTSGGIFWADILETEKHPLQGYHQIVGHSKVKKFYTNTINTDTSITYVDCPSAKYFYELNL